MSLLLISALGLPGRPSFGADAASGVPRVESRVIWVTRWDYRTPQDVQTIIHNAATHYFNVVLFQVRGEATVFYPSKLEPWAWELTSKTPATTGQDPGWDPLAAAVADARAADVELHAYLNILPAWKQKTRPPKDSSHVLETHPDWLMYNREGKPMGIVDGFYQFLNPIHPAVKQHLTALFDELMSRYDLDGVHLDYIRFPDEYRDGDLTYDPVSLGLFKQQFGATPDAKPDEWNRFRADNVSDVVKRIYTTVKARKPSVMVSAAVGGDYAKASSVCRQESLNWLNGGYVDCLLPMNYTSDLDLFKTRGQVFMQGRRRGLIYMGMMAEHGEKTLLAEIAASRALKANGVAVFAYSTLFPNHKPTALAETLKSKVFVRPSRVAGRVYESNR